MKNKELANLKKLGVFNLAQANQIGISQQRISKLVKENNLKRLSRGIYIHPDISLDRDIGFSIACKKFGPSSAIGGLSALFYYNLIDQVPSHIWVIVPPSKNTTVNSYRLIRTKRNIETAINNNNDYRIVSIERAVIEGLKLATKIGERTAIKAARNSLQKQYTSINRIRNVSNQLGLNNILVKYFDSITL
jgi:predicted transcriptional regulator of viral defense system